MTGVTTRTWSSDETIKLWDARTGKTLVTFADQYANALAKGLDYRQLHDEQLTVSRARDWDALSLAEQEHVEVALNERRIGLRID